MERLTFDGLFCDIAKCDSTPGGTFCETGKCTQRRVWERLKEYEDAEEDGRLVVLPCKVGNHVWVDGREAIVEEFFGYETERYLHAQFYDNMQYIDIPFREVGKTVFLTREDAEAALKGGAE